MNAIRITHNPFTVETIFLFGEAEIPSGCSLHRFRALRLQRWVDNLFPELCALFNGRKHFEVTFVGIESDYRDIEEAARLARDAGATITLSWIENAPAEARWQDLQQLLSEVRDHSRYQTMVESDDKLRVLLQEATDRDFDVHVVATMSSGKSTLINAMLGCDLLPSGNEATTSTITRIFDNDHIEPGVFEGTRLGLYDVLDRQEAMDLATMREWNSRTDTRQIELNGNILAVKERDEVRLVLSDTPGPNNSNDDGHRRTTLSYVQDTRRCPMILYVLNATQLGINDDKNLLSLVAKTMSEGGKQNSDRFIFVLNKMDCLDPERGDDVSRILTRARQYLVNQGIIDPQLFPISANLARLLRHRGGSLSKKERWDLEAMQELFGDGQGMDLSSCNKLPRSANDSLSARGLTSLEIRSGVPAVESMIDAHIEKYHLPHRLERARTALGRIVELVVNEAELTAQLDKGESELKSMREEISRLKERSDRGVDIQVYEERVRRESVDLPAEVVEALRARSTEITTLRRELSEEFSGLVAPHEACKRIGEVQSRLQFRFDELINAYEAAFAQSQDLIKSDLETQYRWYVDRVFEGGDPVKFPVLERLKNRVGDFSVSLALTSGDVKKEKKQTGTRRVETSSWWKPWTWGDGYDVAVMTEIEYVNLADFFKDQLVGQMAEFTRLSKDAVDVIDRGRQTLVDGFVGFIAGEFKPRLDELVADLCQRIDEGNAREQALAEARQMLAWGSKIHRRIEALFFVGEPVAEEVA